LAKTTPGYFFSISRDGFGNPGVAISLVVITHDSTSNEPHHHYEKELVVVVYYDY